jgi:hypothetical protein
MVGSMTLGTVEVVGGSWNMGMLPRWKLRDDWKMTKDREKWEKKG